MSSKQLFIISVIIISTACIVIILSIFGSMVLDFRLTEQGRDLLANALSSLIVIVSMIVGNKAMK
tara:strand:+ start:368 stop:562 length:195 start_codon:yes stop_codon:yes gene_type:complete